MKPNEWKQKIRFQSVSMEEISSQSTNKNKAKNEFENIVKTEINKEMKQIIFQKFQIGIFKKRNDEVKLKADKVEAIKMEKLEQKTVTVETIIIFVNQKYKSYTSVIKSELQQIETTGQF